MSDTMQLKTTAVLEKKGRLNKKPVIESVDCNIVASTKHGTVMFDIPEKDMKICCKIEDVMKVFSATNERYQNNKVLVGKGNNSNANMSEMQQGVFGSSSIIKNG